METTRPVSPEPVSLEQKDKPEDGNGVIEIRGDPDNTTADDPNKKSKYSCVKCPFSSYYPGNLRVHMRRHTGEKPFRCEFCQRPFSDKSNLNSHRRRKHTAALVMSGLQTSTKRKSQRASNNLNKSRYYHMYNEARGVGGGDGRDDYHGAPRNLNEEVNGYNSMPPHINDKLSPQGGVFESSGATGVFLQPDFGASDLPTMVCQPNAFSNVVAKGIIQQADNDFPKVFSVESSRNNNDLPKPVSPPHYSYNTEMTVPTTAPVDYSQPDLFPTKQQQQQAYKNSYYPTSTANMNCFEQQSSSSDRSKETENLNNSHVSNVACQTSNEVSTTPHKDSKLYECEHCEILFRDFVMYTIHMGCHGVDDPFRCNVCGLQCGSRHQFACHFARGHAKDTS